MHGWLFQIKKTHLTMVTTGMRITTRMQGLMHQRLMHLLLHNKLVEVSFRFRYLHRGLNERCRCYNLQAWICLHACVVWSIWIQIAHEWHYFYNYLALNILNKSYTIKIFFLQMIYHLGKKIRLSCCKIVSSKTSEGTRDSCHAPNMYIFGWGVWAGGHFSRLCNTLFCGLK